MNNNSNVKEEFFDTYQNYLEFTKNIFINHNAKIKTVKNFDKKFNDSNSKGFRFDSKIAWSFLYTFLISISIILPLFFIGGMAYSVFQYTNLTSNQIGAISCFLIILGIIFLPSLTWILAKLCWRFILNDYDTLSKNLYYLIDSKTINFELFCNNENAIMLLCKTNSHRLSYKIVNSNKTNYELLQRYYEILNSSYNNNENISHNKIVSKLCSELEIDCSASRISSFFNSMKKSNYINPKIRQGFNIRNFYIYSAAIYKNYTNYQTKTN
ncbi:MAG: hypothetical protein IIT78_03195 [Mycoplasmataceae bacterium]|nr:hypothetical protein [Mycoplasmataceae bacterium]